MKDGAEADHAAFEVFSFQVALVVETVALRGRVDHAAQAAAELLELGSRAGASELGQLGLVLGGRDPGERPNLRVGKLATTKPVVEQRQLAEGTGHPHLLAGGAWVKTDAPGKPVGAAQRSLTLPFPAGIEGPHAGEQAMSGGVEVRGGARDLIPQRDRIEWHFAGQRGYGCTIQWFSGAGRQERQYFRGKSHRLSNDGAPRRNRRGPGLPVHGSGGNVERR